MAPRPASDDERSVPVFGGVVLTILAAASTYGVLVALAFLRSSFGEETFREAARHVQQSLLTLTMAQLCGMGSALFVGLRMFEPDVSLGDAVEARPVRARVLTLCIFAGLLLQFPLAELSNLLHEVFGPDPLAEQLALKNLIEARNLGQGMLVVTCLVALVPATEELFFRGFLMFGITRRHGPAVGLIASSVLFGLMHLGAVPAIYATCAGFLLGMLALWTRSVFPGIALHAAVNSVPVLLPEHVLALPGFNVPSDTPAHLSPWLVVPTLVGALGLLALVRRIEYAPER